MVRQIVVQLEYNALQGIIKRLWDAGKYVVIGFPQLLME
jgi:hypothetical protein